jgi:uncharacterized protein
MALEDPTIFDGFSSGDPVQSNRLRATYNITIGGLDISPKINQYLISIRVLAGSMIEDYNCEIELDDTDGQLPIPPIGAPLLVSLGWIGESTSVVFNGTLHDIEHGFGRKQGGRRMWVHGTGQELLGNGKMPNNGDWGVGEGGPDISIAVALQGAATAAGHTIIVEETAAAIKEKHWEQTNEAYYHFARRLAEQYGMTFRVIAGTTGQFTPPGKNVDGTPTPLVQCVFGKNLIGWRVRPFAARPMWAAGRQHHFDLQSSQWKIVEKALGGSGLSSFATATFNAVNPAPNANSATNDVNGIDDGTQQIQGPGRIVINGEPKAQGNAYVQLVGARPGVDGIYLCPTAEHIYSRQGYITWLDVNANTIPTTYYQKWGMLAADKKALDAKAAAAAAAAATPATAGAVSALTGGG